MTTLRISRRLFMALAALVPLVACQNTMSASDENDKNKDTSYGGMSGGGGAY